MYSPPSDIFALAEKRLSWIDQRQSVLAQNIANVNTPGYAAKDVKPFKDVLAAQAQQAAGGFSGVFTSAASADPNAAAKSLSGNAVVLDEQLEKVAETDTAHQLAMNLYKKYASLFKIAIGRN